MKSLTCEQRRFVYHERGAFVKACPGSGKTHTIIERVARLAETLPPNQGIAVLSFTNAAVEEFRRRLLRYGVIHGVLEHPGFVGTFDAFIIRFLFEPSGYAKRKPSVVARWDDLNIRIYLSPRRADPDYRGVPLDAFDPATGTLNVEDVNGPPSFLEHVVRYKTEYEEAARRKRRQLFQAGYFSTADVRVEVQKRLASQEWSRSLGEALASRFHELIVDEAQDCNAIDYWIIRWLRSSGLRVSVVGDPDQAIYEFRGATPHELVRLGNEFPEEDRLTFTGNFRSSPIICALAATLRPEPTPDTALGESRESRIPIQLITYTGRSLSASIGRKFIELVESHGCLVNDSIILAHKRSAAARSAGAQDLLAPSSSRLARLAQAVGKFWASRTSAKVKELALRHVERLILEFMGIPAENALPGRVADKHGIDSRWLRRCAFDVITGLPRECEPTAAARDEWIKYARELFDKLELPRQRPTAPAQFFPRPRTKTWSVPLERGRQPVTAFATVHQAKGTQYDAVCLVISPDDRVGELIAGWENRCSIEAVRVMYVGVTRAKKLLCIAVPEVLLERVERLLEASKIPYQLYQVNRRSG